MESGPQDLVPPHELGKRHPQRGQVEPSHEADRQGNVESRAARIDLVEEPEALLREGQG